MLRSPPEVAEVRHNGPRCLDEQLATEREGIALVFDTQAFKFEGGVNRHEDMVAFGSHGSCW